MTKIDYNAACTRCHSRFFDPTKEPKFIHPCLCEKCADKTENKPAFRKVKGTRKNKDGSIRHITITKYT